MAVVSRPNSARKKQISTNSLFFGSGQASLDICLSFDCLRSSFEKVESVKKELCRLVRTAFEGRDA